MLSPRCMPCCLPQRHPPCCHIVMETLLCCHGDAAMLSQRHLPCCHGDVCHIVTDMYMQLNMSILRSHPVAESYVACVHEMILTHTQPTVNSTVVATHNWDRSFTTATFPQHQTQSCAQTVERLLTRGSGHKTATSFSFHVLINDLLVLLKIAETLHLHSIQLKLYLEGMQESKPLNNSTTHHTPLSYTSCYLIHKYYICTASSLSFTWKECRKANRSITPPRTTHHYHTPHVT